MHTYVQGPSINCLHVFPGLQYVQLWSGLAGGDPVASAGICGQEAQNSGDLMEFFKGSTGFWNRSHVFGTSRWLNLSSFLYTRVLCRFSLETKRFLCFGGDKIPFFEATCLTVGLLESGRCLESPHPHLFALDRSQIPGFGSRQLQVTPR